LGLFQRFPAVNTAVPQRRLLFPAFLVGADNREAVTAMFTVVPEKGGLSAARAEALQLQPAAVAADIILPDWVFAPGTA